MGMEEDTPLQSHRKKAPCHHHPAGCKPAPETPDLLGVGSHEVASALRPGADGGCMKLVQEVPGRGAAVLCAKGEASMKANEGMKGCLP
jgi:hypothetical protein